MARKSKKVFAGAGNRDTPVEYLQLIRQVANVLYQDDWLLHTGAAEGADQAFMDGCPQGELFIPWHGYNGFDLTHKAPKLAYELAIEHHEMGERLELHRGLFALHARNAMIVLGKQCKTPVDILIVYTRDGATLSRDVVPGEKGTGGTGTAIKIAEAYDIPVVNLKDPQSLDLLELWTGVDFSLVKHPGV